MSRLKAPIVPMHGAALGLAAIGLSLASFMQILDQTIANVSLPTIAETSGSARTRERGSSRPSAWRPQFHCR
jgi:hypothetical protein